MSALQDKCLFLTGVDALFDQARAGSLWSFLFGSTMGMGGRSGNISPRKADVLIVSGVITNKMAPVLRRIYEQMPDPKWVISIGSEANGGGGYHYSYAVLKGVHQIIPVDICIPEHVPTRDTLEGALAQLRCKIQKEDTRLAR